MPGVRSGEDEGVHKPAPGGGRIEEQPHLAEVNLHLRAGLGVVHAHRRGPAGPVAQLADAVAVEGPVGHHHPGVAVQERGNLGEGQPVLELGLDESPVGGEVFPSQAVAAGAGGPHGIDHLPDQPIGDLRLPIGLPETGMHRRLDVAANGLAVDLGEAGDRLVAVPPDPQPEHLLDLHHIHLPEHHAAPPARGFR